VTVVKVPRDWTPRPYQLPLWSFLEHGGKRAVAVWHRRAGKDTVGLNWTAVASMQRPGLYWHMLPTYQQGRKIVWDGINKDGRKFLDYWPPEMIENVNNTEMKLEFKNGAIWQVVGTDNVDRLVGANPVGCVLSEYSLQDPRAWNYIRPILAENEGWALFIYTPRGRNHGYTLYKTARDNDSWFGQVLTVDDTGAITPEAVQDERDAAMPEEMIKQEFYCSFDASLVGAYYADQMSKAQDDGRICKVPFEPALPVITAWDLGMHDYTAIWFAQQDRTANRVIDYYEASGLGLEAYARVLKSKPYTYSEHLAPRDIEVREMGTGKSRKEIARNFGITFRTVPQIGVQDGINVVRQFLPKCYFDAHNTDAGLECLKQYTKDFDHKKNMFRDKPAHNWASHGADAFRMLAVGLRNPINLESLPTHAASDYNIFGEGLNL